MGPYPALRPKEGLRAGLEYGLRFAESKRLDTRQIDKSPPDLIRGIRVNPWLVFLPSLRGLGNAMHALFPHLKAWASAISIPSRLKAWASTLRKVSPLRGSGIKQAVAARLKPCPDTRLCRPYGAEDSSWEPYPALRPKEGLRAGLDYGLRFAEWLRWPRAMPQRFRAGLELCHTNRYPDVFLRV